MAYRTYIEESEVVEALLVLTANFEGFCDSIHLAVAVGHHFGLTEDEFIQNFETIVDGVTSWLDVEVALGHVVLVQVDEYDFGEESDLERE